jgi:hypothetical protein
MLSDDERSYELVVLELILAIVPNRRGYDFMPCLVQAADEVSDIRLSPRRQVVL